MLRSLCHELFICLTVVALDRILKYSDTTDPAELPMRSPNVHQKVKKSATFYKHLALGDKLEY